MAGDHAFMSISFEESNSFDLFVAKTNPQLCRFKRRLLYFDKWSGTVLKKEWKNEGVASLESLLYFCIYVCLVSKVTFVFQKRAFSMRIFVCVSLFYSKHNDVSARNFLLSEKESEGAGSVGVQRLTITDFGLTRKTSVRAKQLFFVVYSKCKSTFIFPCAATLSQRWREHLN